MKKCFKRITAIIMAAVMVSNVAFFASADEYHPYGVPDCEIIQPDDVPFTVSDTNFYNSMKTEVERKEAAYEVKKRMRWSLPTSVDLELTHEQQINYYYCGPATAVMILNDFMEAPTQSVIAGNDYLRTTADNGTPWYSGSTQTSLYYFNMGYGLNKWQYDQTGRTAFSYTVCNSGDKEEYIDKIMDTLSNGYAIPLNGRSRSGVNGYLINFQEGHWVAVEGYTNSGSYFKIVDPAAGIPGFENVPQKYTASKSSVQNYISYGIIW